MNDGAFVSGLDLSRRFYEEVVRDRVDSSIGPDCYAAGLVGPGSEVLGLDTERSTDHDWGPRVVVVVGDNDRAGAQMVRESLPPTFAGHSLRFGARHGGSPWIQPVDVVTIDQLFTAWVGFNPLEGLSLLDWLAAPSNGLLMLTAGEVFHDGVGDLTTARAALVWYPDDIWTWMLGCQWRRISEEQAFVGRAVEIGDELGSRVLAARLARDVIRLAFLIERRYAPYSKWLTTALEWLTCGADLRRTLDAALSTTDGESRQVALADAYAMLGASTNRIGIVAPVETTPRAYFSRPYLVGPAAEFAESLLARVDGDALRRLRPHGAIDQLFDSTDGDSHVARPLYRALLDESRPA